MVLVDYLRKYKSIFKFMEQRTKLQIWQPFLFSLVAIAGMFLGYNMRDQLPKRKFFSTDKNNALQEINMLINNKYVDSADLATLTDTAIQAILAKLDPHSVYIPAADLEATNEEIKGSFFGVGIEYAVINDSLNVITVLPNGPAEKAGLQVGDVILSAGDTLLSGVKSNTERIKANLRGDIGSKVKIQLLRNTQVLTKFVERGSIPLKSLDAAYKLDSTTGYIKLNKFSTQTYKEFMTALMKLKAEKITSLVLDLRDNGGGVLDEAVEIADEFLSGDKLITYTEGLHHAKKEHRCRREGQFETGKLVVLCDEGSASASEVLLGALQDWERATIIGRRSFGKGLVQEQYDLSNRAALRLTVARYYTPLGRSIQRDYKQGKKLYYEEAIHNYADTIDNAKNDSAKMVKTASGKVLFGGGGITPDIFMPNDTTSFGAEAIKLYQKGTLSNFGYSYYKNFSTKLQGFKTISSFSSGFAVGEADWQYFTNLAKKDSINVSIFSSKEKTYLQKMLKASIAKQLFKAEGFVQDVNSSDPLIKKALQVVNSK
jgi:carboxyl-terminal processing protease